MLNIKVKGSHELFREFCKAVHFHVSVEIENIAQPESLPELHNDLIEMFTWNAQFLARKHSFPLQHIEVQTDDIEDAEMVEWLRDEPEKLAEVVYVHLAEMVMKGLFEKTESLQVA